MDLFQNTSGKRRLDEALDGNPSHRLPPSTSTISGSLVTPHVFTQCSICVFE